jgi:hypothetical protein
MLSFLDTFSMLCIAFIPLTRIAYIFAFDPSLPVEASLLVSQDPTQKITERTREQLNSFPCNTAPLGFSPSEPKRTQETQGLSTAKPTVFPQRTLPSPNLLISKIYASCLLHLRRFSPTLKKYDAPVELRPLPAAQPFKRHRIFRFTASFARCTGRSSDYCRARTCSPPARLTPNKIEKFGPLAGNQNPVSGPNYLEAVFTTR